MKRRSSAEEAPMSELEALKVRDEVLQAMYWMSAEGLAKRPTESELARFLAVPAQTLAPFLDRFADDGYLQRDGDRFRLTSKGEELGKRSFADEFAELTRPTHGECDEDCWCHSSPEEAARCLEERAHAH
jgi:coproporphyrinogen III oxidase-like Fe-S oxidoreductase